MKYAIICGAWFGGLLAYVFAFSVLTSAGHSDAGLLIVGVPFFSLAGCVAQLWLTRNSLVRSGFAQIVAIGTTALIAGTVFSAIAFLVVMANDTALSDAFGVLGWMAGRYILGVYLVTGVALSLTRKDTSA